MLAELSGCLILATNQVSSPYGIDVDLTSFFSVKISPATSSADDSLVERIVHEDQVYLPTLGRTWYHCVTTRLSMASLASRRMITVQKSPVVPVASIPFEICSAGVLCGPFRE